MPEKSMENRKKILYIITKSVWAGAGKYVYDLSTGLPKENFEVFVAAGGNGLLAEKIKNAEIDYYDITSFQRNISIFKDFFAFFEILSILFKTHPDIIHVSSSKAGGIAGLASVFYKILTFSKSLNIFTVHGWAFNEKRSLIQIKLIKFFSKITCYFYNKIICVSEYDYNIGIKNKIAPAKKMIMIHNGIKPDDYEFLTKEEAMDKLKIQSDKLTIGIIGEFTKNKGQRYLIKALKKLKDSEYDMQAVLIGFGEEKENLKSKIKEYNLENSVYIKDNLPDAYKYLKAFDIFVLTSLKEGLPYVLLEAGLAKLPVITTNVGGIPEIIKDKKFGLLINPSDSKELSEILKKLSKNGHFRQELGNNLYRKIFQDFSMQKMLRHTLAAYKNKK